MSLLHIVDNKTRVSLLKRKIAEKKFVRIIEAHNGLSALIANDAKITLENGVEKEFDGIWESSLTDSASKGFPDIEVVGFDSRLETINQILEVTNKPMIVDGDTGGDFNQFEYTVKRLERAGVSMVIIEDKVFPKRNSLEKGARQDLEKIEVFAEKINRGVKIKTNPDFMVVARLESLIAGYGLDDALMRAEACLKADVDGIMIHSKSTDPTEILEFAKAYYAFPKKLKAGKILIAVPTTYNSITDTELQKVGFQVVIHANHQLRAAYKAMEDITHTILKHDRSFEADALITSVKTVFNKVGFMSVKKKDEEVADKLKSKIKVIIPAAGISELGEKLDTPKSLISIGGKTILQRQVATLEKAGLDNVVVITGFHADKYTTENIKYYNNTKYQNTHIMHSLFTAEKELKSPFILIYSDVLFSSNIVNSLKALENTEGNDIVLVADSSYEHHKHEKHKKLDLIRSNKSAAAEPVRKVVDEMDEKVMYIGKKITDDIAHYEFVGIAYFSEKGAAIINDVYHSMKKKSGTLQEAPSFDQLSFTDVVQEIVDRGYPVNILKTYQGWMEIHNEEDIKIAEKVFKNAKNSGSF
jgi:phosphoenolpyruvate phosphomutase